MNTDRSFQPNQQFDILIAFCPQENIKPQKSREILEKSENPHTVYDTTGESEQPDVTMETNQTSPNHDSVNQVKIKQLLLTVQFI